MQFENTDQNLQEILDEHVTQVSRNWLKGKINVIVTNQSAKDLYLTYSLIPSKIDLVKDLNLATKNSELATYLFAQKANISQVTRIYLLRTVLNAHRQFFTEKVAKLIEVADTGELETFLKFLIVLPNPEDFKNTAVESLRTNVSTVFNAIAYHNHYPSQFFSEQQWNQMFLKTAFMQGDLSAIIDIDKRANKDLARIISDYAHERWAAERDIDPEFWRPIPKFIDEAILIDMQRLLESEDTIENKAGALCCYYSDNKEAKKLLNNYPKLIQQIENKDLNWETIKRK